MKTKLEKPVKLWLKALRSGKYRKGHTYLKSKGKYCCLGVACELYQQEVGGLKEEIIEDTSVLSLPPKLTAFNGVTGDLPVKVKKWLGLRTSDGEFDDHRSLTDINDTRKPNTSFKKIADIIESQPEGLFAKKRKK